jgi:hypothetical protein
MNMKQRIRRPAALPSIVAPLLAALCAVCAAALAAGGMSVAFAADGGETAAPRFAPGELRFGHYDNGLRGVYVKIGDDYVRGCADEEGRLVVAPEKNGPYVGMTNGFALINEGARDANGVFIPEEAQCVALNAAGERVRTFDNYITWYDGKHGVAAVSVGGEPQRLLYALTDEAGKPITAFEFDAIHHAEESASDVFWAQKDGLWGCVKADGGVKLPFAYRRLHTYQSNGGRPSRFVNLTHEFGNEAVATQNGDIVIPAEYPLVGAFFDDPLVPVINDEGKYAYFNDAGENVTGFVYDHGIGSFSEGLAQIYTGSEDGSFGFIDTNFRTVIPPVYTGLRNGHGTRPGKLYLYRDGAEEVVENPLRYERDIKIYADGDWIYTAEEAFIEDGRTLAPFRRVAEALGYSVRWYPDSREIALADGTRSVRLTVGKDGATVNLFNDGTPPETVTLDVPPRIVGGRAYVPLRFIAEACGARVDWDRESSEIRITRGADRLDARAAELAPANINGGSTGVFARRQLAFLGFRSVEADVTLPTVTVGEKGDCPYVYFGFDRIGDIGNAEGGFQYIEDETRADFGKWTVFLRQGDEWRWGENIVLESGSTHHLKFHRTDAADGAPAELVLELNGREVIRKPSSVNDFSGASVKYVVAIAMSKPFDGENCLSRADNAKIANPKASNSDFYDYALYGEWRPDIGDGVLFGSADCTAAYVHRRADGSISLWKEDM